jgi:mRNA-degrading endonuclease RelE of RelBE toxin-antitoxin system
MVVTARKTGRRRVVYTLRDDVRPILALRIGHRRAA